VIGDQPANTDYDPDRSEEAHTARRRLVDEVSSRDTSLKRPTPVGLVVKPIGKPNAGNRHVRLCVQRRLACSAGFRPAGARVWSPVAWIAGWRETKTLKPIDKVSQGEITSHRAVTTVNAQVASKVSRSEGRARNRRAKAAWGAEIWPTRHLHLGGVEATARWQGHAEQLEKPSSSRREIAGEG
jgi:hypothetical protein